MEPPQEDCWEIVDCRTDWETGHAWEIVKSSRKTLQILTPDSNIIQRSLGYWILQRGRAQKNKI